MAAAIIAMQATTNTNNTIRGAYGPAPLPPKNHTPKHRKNRWWSRRWSVVSNGSTEPSFFFKYKNAAIYASEMNAWSSDYFDNQVFTVERRFNDRQS